MTPRIDAWVRRFSGPAEEAATGKTARPAVLLTIRGRRLRAYLISFALVLAITWTGLQIEHQLTATNLAMVYLLAVVVSALRWGLWPAVVTAVSSTLIFTYFFIPPYESFAFRDDWYLITFVTFLVVGLLVSRLASEAVRNAERAQRQAGYAQALYSLGESLIAARDIDQIFRAVERHILATFHRPAAMLLAGGQELAVRLTGEGYLYGAWDRAAAAWAWRNGSRAGRWSAVFPEAHGHYLPLRSAGGIEGVLGIQAAGALPRLTAEQDRLLEASASRAALAIERARLEEKAQQSHLVEERNRVHKALLNSVSHNLRTPLASISGTLSSLLEDGAALPETIRRELLESALEQSVALNRLVSNLLDVTRLEAGALRLRIEPCEVQDLVGAVLAQLGTAIANRRITADIPPGMPLVSLDYVIVSQVLVNLVENALEYSPAERPVEISARVESDRLIMRVADHGDGVPLADLERIFERFHRAPHAAAGKGIGLGLYLSKGFIEAHGGRIWAEQRPEGGMAVAFVIPRASRSEPVFVPMAHSFAKLTTP